MPNTFFISDLHLHPSRPGVFRALDTFLQQHTDSEALYVLGDLFELWVGDDDDSALAMDTCALLRRFSDEGPDLYLMHGNRDFLLGDDFASRAGARLLADPTVINLFGKATLLMHGDSLCTADEEYQAFRREARSDHWQSALLSQSLQQRYQQAAALRSMSMTANSNKAENILDVTPDEVNRLMAEKGVKQLIHGHTHRPGYHLEEHGTRWVLGDWLQQGWALEANQDGLELKIIPI